MVLELTLQPFLEILFYYYFFGLHLALAAVNC